MSIPTGHWHRKQVSLCTIVDIRLYLIVFLYRFRMMGLPVTRNDAGTDLMISVIKPLYCLNLERIYHLKLLFLTKMLG